MSKPSMTLLGNLAGLTPTQLAELDLDARAFKLGPSFLLPNISTFTTDTRGTLVPVEAAHMIQTEGIGIHGHAYFHLRMYDPEIRGMPDSDTLTALPWDPDTAWIACNIYFKGQPFDQCPRLALIRLHEEARDMGYVIKTGIEPEFTLLKMDKHEGLNDKDKSYIKFCDPYILQEQGRYIKNILRCLKKLKWGPYDARKECEANQFEFSFGYSDALTTADRTVFFKYMVKTLALQEGFRASFMPKPFPGGVFGSGLHLNMSVWDTNEDVNLFPDPNANMGLSEIARQFTGGILAHAEALTALVCPTVNSYRRLFCFPNIFSLVAFGRDSRIPIIRIPNNERIEYRVPDGSANPYLLHAGILAAGLDGIKRKLDLDPKMCLEEDCEGKPRPKGYRELPDNLNDALKFLEKDEILIGALGKPLIDAFVHKKRAHWKEYLAHITEWEKDQVDEY